MDTRTIKRRALAAMRDWQTRLGLSDWEIALEFQEGDGSTFAEAVPDPNLLDLHVTFYLAPHRAEPHHIEGTIAHELLHAVLSPLMSAMDSGLTREEAIPLEEQAVTRIERALTNRFPRAVAARQRKTA